MAFTGIASVVYGTPDPAQARQLFADWGLTATRRGNTHVAFETGAGAEVIVRSENASGLPPRINANSNFREIIWGVSSQKHLVSLGEDLSRDRKVTLDKAGTLHTTDDSGIHIGFRL